MRRHRLPAPPRERLTKASLGLIRRLAHGECLRSQDVHPVQLAALSARGLVACDPDCRLSLTATDREDLHV